MGAGRGSAIVWRLAKRQRFVPPSPRACSRLPSDPAVVAVKSTVPVGTAPRVGDPPRVRTRRRPYRGRLEPGVLARVVRCRGHSPPRPARRRRSSPPSPTPCSPPAPPASKVPACWKSPAPAPDPTPCARRPPGWAPPTPTEAADHWTRAPASATASTATRTAPAPPPPPSASTAAASSSTRSGPK